MIDNKMFTKGLGLLTALLFTLSVSAQHEHATVMHANDSTESHEQKFAPGPFIMDHIGDAYEWHILDQGDFHLSVPLPVIVYSQHSGLNVFMSSHFHHGHESYKGFSIAHDGDHKGKVVELVGDEEIVPLDLSITKNVVSLFVSVIILMWIFFSIAARYKANPKSSPKGLQSLLEPLIMFVRDDIAKASIGHHYMKFTPYLLTIFFFIFFNNLMGLIPIFPFGANLTGNIAVTMVLAVLTFLITTFVGNKAYWTHIINAPGVPWWLKFPVPLMPVVELMGVLTKPFVLMVRLFANITAGHIIALGFFSLIFIFGEINVGLGYGVSILSVAFTIFMTMLELLVALIQAYVFTLLSALYFGMAMEEHHEH